MTIVRGLAAAVVFACVALGFASPARADQVMEGVYTYLQEGQPPATWTIYPICVPTVGDLREPLYLPVACTLHVTGSSGMGGGDARLTGGLWTCTQSKREGMKCPDGSMAPITETFEFDDVTMSGTRTTTHSAACGLQPAMYKHPFTLAFKEPLTIPVDRYPLICEPGGLRRCF